MAATGTIDWNERQLCDDGACTGVIGRDGQCGECGRAAQFWGDERRRGTRDDEEVVAEVAVKRAVPAAEGDIADRRLCPDGGCTGLIGPDGRCKVCGTLDEAAPVRTGAIGAVAGVGAFGVDGDGALAGDAEDAAGDADVDGDDEDDDGDAIGDDASARRMAAQAGDGADDDRRVCPDGACTGLIGADGRCKVCGTVEEP